MSEERLAAETRGDGVNFPLTTYELAILREAQGAYPEGIVSEDVIGRIFSVKVLVRRGALCPAPGNRWTVTDGGRELLKEHDVVVGA